MAMACQVLYELMLNHNGTSQEQFHIIIIQFATQFTSMSFWVYPVRLLTSKHVDLPPQHFLLATFHKPPQTSRFHQHKPYNKPSHTPPPLPQPQAQPAATHDKEPSNSQQDYPSPSPIS